MAKSRKASEAPTATAMARGSPKRALEEALAARGGLTRGDLIDDASRGASSPLGHGHEMKKKKGSSK
jgi:hypothetical protein